MRLHSAQIVPFSIALNPPLDTAQGRVTTREGFILKLVDDCGKVGLGEASPAYWLDGRPLSETREALEAIVGKLNDCSDAAELRSAVLNESGAACSSSPAACALDTALLDLEARSRRLGVAKLLGGASDEPVPICALLVSRTPAAIEREALSALDSGCTVFKLKVGAGTLAEDLANLEALRGAIGAAGFVRLDANRAWDFEQAVSALSAFGPEKIEFVEEPLRLCTPSELARLRGAIGVALALDESIGFAADVEDFCTAPGPAPVIVLKTSRLGGPSKCLEVARTAHGAGVTKVVVTDSIESAVGMSTAVHLAAAISNAPAAVGLGGARFGFALTNEAAGAGQNVAWVLPCGPGLDISFLRSNSQ